MSTRGLVAGVSVATEDIETYERAEKLRKTRAVVVAVVCPADQRARVHQQLAAYAAERPEDCGTAYAPGIHAHVGIKRDGCGWEIEETHVWFWQWTPPPKCDNPWVPRINYGYKKYTEYDECDWQERRIFPYSQWRGARSACVYLAAIDVEQAAMACAEFHPRKDRACMLRYAEDDSHMAHVRALVDQFAAAEADWLAHEEEHLAEEERQRQEAADMEAVAEANHVPLEECMFVRGDLERALCDRIQRVAVGNLSQSALAEQDVGIRRLRIMCARLKQREMEADSDCVMAPWVFMRP